MLEIWKPSVTVAAIIEKNGSFLLVEEEAGDGIKLNQPAGHLEPNESLIDAVIRETLEETAHDFTPTALVGTYLSPSLIARQTQPITYLRFAFTGELGQSHSFPLDQGIIRAVWMTYEEISANTHRHRSPMVLQCIDDYLAGQRASLALVYTHPFIGGSHHD